MADSNSTKSALADAIEKIDGMQVFCENQYFRSLRGMRSRTGKAFIIILKINTIW